jgi:cytidylate kinase
MSISRRLATYLNEHQESATDVWEAYDHNTIVEEMLESHRMPAHYAEYLPEDASSFVPDTLEDLLGLHPSASELVRHLSETIVALARKGSVILVGRAANVITARLPHVIHVRIVASRQERVLHMETAFRLSHQSAVHFVEKTDRGRMRFLRQNFGEDVANPVSYDLTINTGRISFDEAAVMIGDVVLRRMVSEADHGKTVPSRKWSLASAS